MARTQSTQPTPAAPDTESDNPTTTTTPEPTTPPPDQGGDVDVIRDSDDELCLKSTGERLAYVDILRPEAPRPTRQDVAVQVCCALLSHGRYAGSLSEQDLAVLRDRAYAIADAMLTPPDPA